MAKLYPSYIKLKNGKFDSVIMLGNEIHRKMGFEFDSKNEAECFGIDYLRERSS